MNIIIQNNSMIPIYDQICSQIKSLILNEKLKESSPLPSVRSLAKELKISALTVKKAYDLLEKEGFIATIHGKGSYVLPVNPNVKKEEILYQIQLELEGTIQKARNSGITKKELSELVEMLLKEES
ncbi:GntR family transcriptional regulator [Candidatus Enterococcus willemsii]|uniref:GntR family transcriptional regulator n=1 Tax=Candidatus Enterococcus willemsii TaxID=1857215 RepID=A0ABQ6YYM2_9ENTE|nr:GntR family transcriptional regulator [Enterococcus sp. CU12B]KAF1302884.1 GntR family transcriptional regulator [Enterococcus sp. CU12B]